MRVTSAVRDSPVTLPIMPKAPASVNVAAPRRLLTFVFPAKAGTQRHWYKRHWIPAFAGMTIQGIGSSQIGVIPRKRGPSGVRSNDAGCLRGNDDIWALSVMH